MISPLDPQERMRQALARGLANFGRTEQLDNFGVQPLDEFNYASKAEAAAFKADQLARTLSSQTMKNSFINARNQQVQQYNRQLPPVANPRFAAFLQAISGQESGGNYSAVNPDSGAMGKYQIMPGNIQGSGGWDMEALGRNISEKFFLNHPRAQERIARNKLRDYFKNYGPAGAASAWYSGDPNAYRDRLSQGDYPSIHDYVQSILQRMRRG